MSIFCQLAWQIRAVFDDIIKALRGIEGQQPISVPLPLDDEG